MTNYYAVLGVSESATDQEIRAAYHRLLQDSLMDQDRFTTIKEAYETLGNPESRQTYDRDRLTPPGPGATAVKPAAAPPARTQAPADSTMVMPSTDRVGTGPSASVERTGTAPLRKPSSSDATMAMLPAQCSVCGHLNPPGETYCAECGFLLSSSAEKGAFLPTEEEIKNWPHLEDDTGQVYTLRPGTNTVGRESADIRIPDKTVSRHHATIVFHEERGLFSVEDKGSTNGTGVNGQVLPSGVPHPIHSGDQVRFGSFVLTLIAPQNRTVEPTQIMGEAARSGGASFYDDAQGAGQSAYDDMDDDYADMEADTLAAESEPGSALAQLILAQGFGPREVAIERGATTVGRLPDNTLCLKHDRYVSGHHARIVAEDNVFRLLDVGSTNGTMLNGLRLTTNEAIAISEGDEVTFGGTVYQFHILAPSETEDAGDSAPERTDMPEAQASGEAEASPA